MNSPNAFTAFSMTSADAIRLAAGLTIARFIAAPVIGALLLLAPVSVDSALLARSAALGVFVAASLTDWADGWIARRFNASTPLGAAMDHAADKVLTTATLIALSATIWPAYLAAVALVLIARDMLVAGLREGMAMTGRALPVDATGKWKTALLMLGLIAGLLEGVLMSWPPSGVADAAMAACHLGLGGALILSLWSAAVYVRRAVRPDAA